MQIQVTRPENSFEQPSFVDVHVTDGDKAAYTRAIEFLEVNPKLRSVGFYPGMAPEYDRGDFYVDFYEVFADGAVWLRSETESGDFVETMVDAAFAKKAAVPAVELAVA